MSSSSDFYVRPDNKVLNRDVILKMHMAQCQADYTKEKDFKIFVGSWNVNGQSVTEDLYPWLGDYPEESARPADIVALGFQELDLRTEAYIFYESHKEAEWLKACDSCLRRIVQRYNKLYGRKWENAAQAYQNHYISPKKYSIAHNKALKGFKQSASSLDLASSETNSDEEYKDSSPYISASRRASFAKRKKHPTIDQGFDALNLENEETLTSELDNNKLHGKAAFYTDTKGHNRPVTGTQSLEDHERQLHPAIEVKDEEIEEITPFSPYVKLHLVRLVGIMMVVFVKKDILPYITDIASETIGTGLLGKMGNKGAVAIRFNLHGTPLCFVNSHFAAHPEELERRNQDYQDIANKIQFSQCAYIGILDHDFVFWFGDLNYRVDVANQEHAKKQITNNQIGDLMKFDQLTKQKEYGRIFPKFTEGAITFPPTYKYDPGTDIFDTSEKARVPSWCDRILWRAEHSGKIHLVCYRSHPSMRLSDHKPVSALFNIKIQVINQSKFNKVYEFAMKNIDKLENDYLPQAKIDKTEVNFGDISFMEHRTRNIILTNIGQVPIQFEFIKKPGNKSYCKSWLVIKPFKYLGSNFVHPGDNCKIELSCYVTKSQAPILNAGADQLEDILVLHLENGKDFFISVIGRYIKSSFGASLEELVDKGDVPYRKANEKPLIDLSDDNDICMESKRKITSQNFIAFSLIDAKTCKVPIEIWIMVAQILERGIKEPELFQRPGLMREILTIRNSVDTGSREISSCSVHSVCDAFIIFLEALRHPVFPTKLYESIFLSFVLSPPPQTTRPQQETTLARSKDISSSLSDLSESSSSHPSTSVPLPQPHFGVPSRPPPPIPPRPQRSFKRDYNTTAGQKLRRSRSGHKHPVLHKAHKMITHARGNLSNAVSATNLNLIGAHLTNSNSTLHRSRSNSPPLAFLNTNTMNINKDTSSAKQDSTATQSKDSRSPKIKTRRVHNTDHTMMDFPQAGEVDLNFILDQMPLTNRDTLRYILSFLQCLLDHSSYNGVDYDLLSSIFSRVIIREEALISDSNSKTPSVPDKARTSLRDMSIQDQYYLDKKRKAFFTQLLLNSS